MVVVGDTRQNARHLATSNSDSDCPTSLDYGYIGRLSTNLGWSVDASCTLQYSARTAKVEVEWFMS
jgi:hypothetical protein